MRKVSENSYFFIFEVDFFKDRWWTVYETFWYLFWDSSTFFFTFLFVLCRVPCVKQVNSSLHKQSLISQKVRLSVCVCVWESSVGSHEWIFLKFCMQLDDVVNSDTTEPDFRFLISFRTYCPKSVKMAVFQGFWLISQKRR